MTELKKVNQIEPPPTARRAVKPSPVTAPGADEFKNPTQQQMDWQENQRRPGGAGLSFFYVAITGVLIVGALAWYWAAHH